MKACRLFGLMLVFLSITAIGNANVCGHRTVTINHGVVATEVIIPVVQPLVVVPDPRLSYHYIGAVTPPAQAKTYSEAEVKKIVADAIERRPQVVRKSGPPRVPGFKPASFASRSELDVLKANCAACHTEGKNKGNGVDIIGPNGQLSAHFNAAAAWDAVQGGRMPPGRQLSAEDFGILSSKFGK